MKKCLIGLIFLLSFSVINGQIVAVQPSGSGTDVDPYRIATVENLIWLSENNTEWGSTKYYVQTDSIDLYKLDNFSPIGNAVSVFNGKYDGKDNLILNLTIFDKSESDLGLFGVIGINAEIKNINLQFFDIVGKNRIGSIAGNNNGSLNNCTGRGVISILDSSGSISGGLVGKNERTINMCSILIQIAGANKVGGLVGENLGGQIKESYSEGEVKGREYVGGLIGNNDRKYATQIGKVSNCYSHAEVVRTSTSVGEKIGGFIGGNNSEVEHSYSTGKVTYENVAVVQPGEKVWPERLRGISMGLLSVNMMEEDVFIRMADWGANLITVNFGHDEKLNLPDIPEAPTVPDSMMYYKNGLYILDKFIQNAKKYKIFVNIQASRAWGYEDIKLTDGETTAENDAQEQYYLEKLKELHVYLGMKYKDNPTVLAYNYIAEVVTPYIGANWVSKVVPEIVAAFREVDQNTFLIISSGMWLEPRFGDESSKYPRISEPVDDPANKIIYGMHCYAPLLYTHQGIQGHPDGVVYPGMIKAFNYSPLIWWDRDELENYIHFALEFSKKYNVKLIDTEFSSVRNIPSADKWFDDRISTYEEYGISWTAFNFGNTSWDGWNLTVADDAPWGHVSDSGVETNRLKVVKKYLRKNTEFND